MVDVKTDLCVIGAGSGGLSVAAGAVQMGARVVLLEGHKMGGDCLNHGCVPSKALIAAARHAHAMQSGRPFGISPARPDVDYAAVKDHVAEVIAQIAPHDSVERFEGLGVRVIPEYGHFISADVVQAGNMQIRARRFVIATGSSPLVPSLPGLGDVPYETNETIFDLREQPGHLLVIGGGPIGMEMAQAHRRLGSRVTVIEGMKALGRDDPELAAIVLERMRGEGISIEEGITAVRVRGKAGRIEIKAKDGRVLRGTHLLIATGRRPNVERLNLGAAGIRHDRDGIAVRADLRTSNRRVYAIGDVTRGLRFTHVAGYHAGVVIRSALFGLPAKAKTGHIPWVTYTDPELAQVGLTEEQARTVHGARLEILRFGYDGNDRAIAERRAEGLIKVMVVKGRPVGVSIVGAQAGETIGLWAMAIANRLKMGAVAATVMPYPTLGEISKRAAGAYFSPRLFDNIWVKRFVGFVQRRLP